MPKNIMGCREKKITEYNLAHERSVFQRKKKHLLLKPFYALVSLDAVSGGVLRCRIVEHSRTLQLDHDGLREQ